MVLVLSEAANQSPFVQREVERAVSKRKPVFPIRIEEVLPSPSLELFVSTTQWIDAWTGSMSEHVERLAGELSDQTLITRTTAATRKAVRRRHMPKWLAIAGGFVGIVLAIVIGNQLSRSPSPTPDFRSDKPSSVALNVPADAPPATAPASETNAPPRGNETHTAIEEDRPQRGSHEPTSETPSRESPPARPPATHADLPNGNWSDKLSDGLITFAPLSHNLGDIQRIRIGASSDHLDRIIDVLARDEQAGRIDPFFIRDERPSNPRPIPLPDFADSIYVQVEFKDGGTSAARRSQVRLGQAPNVQFRALDAPESAATPALFAALNSDGVCFLPMSPPGTSHIQFSIDDGEFRDFPPCANRMWGEFGRTPQPWQACSEMRLKFRTISGWDIGPVRYSMDGLKELVVQSLKEEVNKSLRDLIQCRRLMFASDTPGRPARVNADHKALADALRTHLHTTRLRDAMGDVDRIIVFPALELPRGQSPGLWAAVNEIRVGFKSDHVEQQASVGVNFNDVLADPHGPHQPKWTIILSGNGNPVYVSLSFHDGSVSQEIRVPVQILPVDE